MAANIVAQAFYLAAPVTLTAIGHMVVVKKNLWPSLCVPLDGGRSFGGQALFGPNKTWRGVAVMVLGSSALGALLGLFFGRGALASGVAYADPALLLGLGEGAVGQTLAYGALHGTLGLGYVLGELPNSFLKRRVGIAPGKTAVSARGLFFFVLDQADSVAAALGLGWLLFAVPGPLFWVGLAFLSGLHLFLNGSLFLLRVRKNL